MKKTTPLLALFFFTMCYSETKQDITASKTSEIQKNKTEKHKQRRLKRLKIIKEQQWKPLHSDLWQSKTGEIGFQVAVMNPETLGFDEGYLTHTCDDKPLPFNQLIDIDSFHNLNASNYYKDKNHLYQFVAMAGGGTFSVFDKADYDSFEVLNSFFAKDNKQIFHWRGRGNDYDYASFQTCADCGSVAKDKNTYYAVGQKLTQAEVDKMIANSETHKETQKALKILRNK